MTLTTFRSNLLQFPTQAYVLVDPKQTVAVVKTRQNSGEIDYIHISVFPRVKTTASLFKNWLYIDSLPQVGSTIRFVKVL